MKNKLTTFYLIRHGETDWNKKKILQGQRNTHLNETGKKQAKELAKKLREVTFDLAFSSDLLRAKRTTEIIALEHNLAVQTTKTLRERNFGSLEGKPSYIMLEHTKLLKELSDEERKKQTYVPDAESDEDMVTRVFTFLRETAIAYPGKTVLIGSHSGILLLSLIHLGKITYKEIDTMRFINGGYIKLTSDGVDFFVQEINGFEARQNGSADI